MHKVQIKYLFPFLQFLFGSVPAFPPFILWSSVDLNLLFVLLKKKKNHLSIFPSKTPARQSLMLPGAEKILADVKRNGALPIKSTSAFCKQSAPGARV